MSLFSIMTNLNQCLPCGFEIIVLRFDQMYLLARVRRKKKYKSTRNIFYLFKFDLTTNVKRNIYRNL